ncbi:MAG: helix-turn-helix domain-containing protein [Chlorobi bacterium]|nr:helix-turn-helix domain-containing protein [Chlorobiota bacterium]
METLKYGIIKTKKQYIEYCDILERLVDNGGENSQDEIELLGLLIEKWDSDHTSLSDLSPIELIKSLMRENNLKSKDLAVILGLSKGTVSKILNYRKGLSKETIRILANHFKISQEAFNRPYKLINGINRNFKNANLMNTTKNIDNAVSI